MEDQPDVSAKFILSTKGKKLIASGEFIFRKTKVSNGMSYWICTHYDKSSRCRCSLKVIDSSDPPMIMKRSREHNHCASFGTVEAKEMVQRMKDRSSTTNEAPSQIYASTIASSPLNDFGAIAMGRKDAVKRAISRKRRKNNQQPALPTSLRDFEILTFQTSRQENLVLYDSGSLAGGRRLIVFSNDFLSDNMVRHTEWHGDGTFKTVPRLFTQMYTIHFVKNDEMFAGVYALLTHKDLAMYKDLLQVLKQQKPELNPTSLMHDFESAAMRAFTDEFPNVIITGCLFNLSQSVQRKVQELGLKTLFQSHPNFFTQVKSLAALAFVPESDVQTAFNVLTSQAMGWPSNAERLAKYFGDTYIGNTDQQGTIRRPLFPPNMWNVRQRTIEGKHRTNNSVEGWHHGFGILVGGCHVNVWRFLNCVK